MNLTVVNLKNALAQPGCPLCTLQAEAERRYLRSVLHEYVNDWHTRRHIIASLGYCADHIAQAAQMEITLQGDSLGNSIIYEHLVGVVAGQLSQHVQHIQEHRRPFWRRWLNKLRSGGSRIPPLDDLKPQASCRVCQMGEKTASAYARWLIEALSDNDDDFRELYKSSEGLCLQHLTATLERATPAETTGLEFLMTVSLTRLQQLQYELAEYVRKQSWDNRDETETAAELTAWRRAALFFGGTQDV